MKIASKLMLLLLSLVATATLATSCTKDADSGGQELSALSYPTGEIALANTTYTSATPTLYATQPPQFSITKVTRGGVQIDNTNPAIMSINPSSGVITAVITDDISYVGEYFVSVNVRNSIASRTYDNALRLVVKGISFADDMIALARGEAAQIKPTDIHIAQGEGTEFTLVVPEAEQQRYAGITLDKHSCTLNIAATTQAGFYPISIKVNNRTNDGTVLENVTQIVVESAPYGLSYTPASATLLPGEGFVSAAPEVFAASAVDKHSVRYEIENNPSRHFSIDPATGAVSVEADNELLTAATYALRIKVSNSLGSTLFTDAMSIIIDPNKQTDPITAVTYPDTFPVELKAGQPWKSGTPAVTGSGIMLRFSLTNAPTGVSIDPKTGVITLEAGHRLSTVQANTLSVSVTNAAAKEPFETIVGDFKVTALIWEVELKSNSPENTLTYSGIVNMDRYSFLGRLIQSDAAKVQVKNGWGIAASRTEIDGLNCSKAEATANGVQQWNNDWLVSSEFRVESYAINPVLLFDMVSGYGTNAANMFKLHIYAVDTDAQSQYVKQPEAQDSESLDLSRTPSSLQWTEIWSTSTPVGDIAAKPQVFAPQSFPLSAYKGKKVRFALQFYNPTYVASEDNNKRTYRIKVDGFRVEDVVTTNR